jgi:hypothetical protein
MYRRPMVAIAQRRHHSVMSLARPGATHQESQTLTDAANHRGGEPMTGPGQPVIGSGAGGGGQPSPESIATALDWAEVSAMLGDYSDAVRWLDVAERVAGGLPDRLLARREQWREHVL